MDGLLSFDRDLFLWLNSLGSSPYDFFWMMMTNKLTNVLVYLTATFYFYKKTDLKQLLGLFIFVALLILAMDQTTNLFKYQIARLRPCHDLEISSLVRLVKPNCGGQFSFFSGHSSNSFALATFFSLLLRTYLSKFSFVFFFIAALIAYSRVYIGVHYPLDIFVGALFGMLYGALFYRLWKSFILPRLR